MKILAICGSLKKSSSNLTLLEKAQALVQNDSQITVFAELGQLPWFNPDLLAQPLPNPVIAWKQALAESDAILFACPEYGHSLPGVLKNGIDWVIGSGELYNKRVAITASVAHPERGLKGLGALHQTLSAVDANIVFGDTILQGEDESSQIVAMLEEIICGG